MIITFPNVLVIGPKVQAKSMSDLVKLEKNKPGSLNFASSGIGSTQHLAGGDILEALWREVPHLRKSEVLRENCHRKTVCAFVCQKNGE